MVIQPQFGMSRSLLIEADDLIPCYIDGDDLGLIARMAKAAEVGGHSHIYQGAERQMHMAENQLTGQVGEFVLLTSLLPNGRAQYIRQRELRNENPWAGDGGSDLEGCNLDVKATVLRRPNGRISDKELRVLKPEFHHDWVYALVVVKANTIIGGRGHLTTDAPITAYLVGWSRGRDLYQHPRYDNTLMRPVLELNPFPPLRFDLRGNG